MKSSLKLTDLRKLLLESLINPRQPRTIAEKATIEVGNPGYWVTKAREYLAQVNSPAETDLLCKEAITLLLLARGQIDVQLRAEQKQGEEATGSDIAIQDNCVVEVEGLASEADSGVSEASGIS